MHTLNLILVNLRDVEASAPGSRELTLDRIRCYAADATEPFCGDVFDWRETDTAGRWSHRFDPNVILVSDAPDTVLGMLKDLKDAHGESVRNSVQKLRDRLGTSDLEQLIGRDLGAEMRFYLQDSVDYLTGRYNVMSAFYDTCHESSRITDALLSQVRDHPEDWAAVLFDQHW